MSRVRVHHHAERGRGACHALRDPSKAEQPESFATQLVTDSGAIIDAELNLALEPPTRLEALVRDLQPSGRREHVRERELHNARC